VKTISLGEGGTYSIIYIRHINNILEKSSFENLEYLASLYERYFIMNENKERNIENWNLLGLDTIKNFSWDLGEKKLPKCRISFLRNDFEEDGVSINIDESEGEKDFKGLVKKLLEEKGYELKL